VVSPRKVGLLFSFLLSFFLDPFSIHERQSLLTAPHCSAAESESLMQRLGAVISHLHDGNLVHGDLTTSNLLLRPGEGGLELVVIDFGLSYNSTLAEDKAVDLYVLERAFSSAHADEGARLVGGFSFVVDVCSFFLC
jgi:Kae1-associated kinase Bud32